MHRFFVPAAAEAQPGQSLTLPADVAHQLHHVLRMQPGDAILLLDNAGWMLTGRLTAVSVRQVTVEIEDRRPAGGEPPLQLTLYQALLPRDKFEWVLQKGTEVGVSRFVPVVTQRSLVQTTALKANKRARWEKILAEAAEQCRRGRIPTLASPLPLAQALAEGKAADVALMAWEEVGNGRSLTQAMPLDARSIALFIGPEGGFAPEEVAAAQTHGVQPVTLGPRILRTETAAIVASALLVYAAEREGREAGNVKRET